MPSETVTLQLPAHLYSDLEALANETRSDPVALITAWVHETQQRRRWKQGWATLRAQVQGDKKVQVEVTSEEIVEQTRRVREDIFEIEYAHLYR